MLTTGTTNKISCPEERQTIETEACGIFVTLNITLLKSFGQ